MNFSNSVKSRLVTLITKETRQIVRDKRLIFLLIALPIIQLLTYGFALNPDVRHLNLGVVDYSKTLSSRELLSALTENELFSLTYSSDSEKNLYRRLDSGQLTVGIIIPPNYENSRRREKTAKIQVIIDAVNANTAGLARSYINEILNYYNKKIDPNYRSSLISLDVLYLYNQNLVTSWFFVSGIAGIIITLVGSIVSGSTIVREKELGTLKQLLMTPAANWQILLAKVFPIYILLVGNILFILFISSHVFSLPLGNHLFACLMVSLVYIFGIIEMGIYIGTFFENQQQTQLVAFSLNIPLALMSGTLTPIESMPPFFQQLSLLNPLRHYIVILRGLLIKNLPINYFQMNFAVICLFSFVLFIFSVSQFRSQLKF
jgi:ABC-2 type transport system permease protein